MGNSDDQTKRKFLNTHIPEPPNFLLPGNTNLVLVPKQIDPDRLIVIGGKQYLLEPWEGDK